MKPRFWPHVPFFTPKIYNIFPLYLSCVATLYNRVRAVGGGGGGGEDTCPFRPFHHLLVNSVRILVNENLAKRSSHFRTFHHLLVTWVKILVNENLAKRSSHFRTFHHFLVNSVKILVNENLAKKSCPLGPFHNFLVYSVKILVNENLAKGSSLFARSTVACARFSDSIVRTY